MMGGGLVTLHIDDVRIREQFRGNKVHRVVMFLV